MFPGGQAAADDTDANGSLTAYEALDGPERTGTHTILGVEPGRQLGAGALAILPATADHPIQLLVGAPTDPTMGRSAGSITAQAIPWSREADYAVDSPPIHGGAGASLGCTAAVVPATQLVAVSACTRSAEAGEGLGAVYLFHQDTLQTGGLAWEEAAGRVEGTEARSHLGHSLAVGDLDGDGATDLVVGAPSADGGRGRVYLIEDVGASPWVSTADLTPLAHGTAGDDALGTSMVLGGDLTGDGHADLVVCAPGWDIAGIPSAGACGVIAGGIAGPIHGNLEDHVTSVVYGSRLGDQAGAGDHGVAVGPFLGDTLDGLSLAVGLAGAEDGGGSVLVVGPSDLDGYVSATAATLRIDGDGGFGTSLAPLPGGGLLVGAPGFGSGGAAFALLPDRIWMPTGERATAGDIATGIWVGLESGGGLGTRVAGGTDLDGDLWPDIVLGAPGPSESSPGSVSVQALPAGWPTKGERD